MQKLIIHIGTHKTGTSAFQRVINKEKFRLAKKDKIFVVNLNGFHGIKKFMKAKSFDKSLVNELEEFLGGKMRNTQGVFLVSFEGFSGDINCLYANSATVARMLYEATRRYSLEIIVFLRRQDEFLQSAYTQKIHEGESLAVEQFLAQQDLGALDWNKFLEPYVTRFGRDLVHVFPYDKDVLQEKTVVELINTVLNSKVLSEAEGSIQVNVGFSPAAMKISEELNPALSESQRRILRLVLQDISNKGMGREYNILAADQKKDLVEKFKESNSILAISYFKNRFGMTNFSEPVYEKIHGADVSLNEEYRKVLKTLLGMLAEKEKEQHGIRGSFFMRGVYVPLARFVKRVFYKLD